MPWGVTVGETISTLDEWGVVEAETALSKLDDHVAGMDLEYFGLQSRGEAIVCLLEEVGRAISIPNDDIELEHGYHGLLEAVTTCTDGALVVTDVTLVQRGGRDDLLRFRVNGQWHEWNVEHVHPEYLDQLTILEKFGTLTPPGTRRWADVPADQIGFAAMVFAEPSALDALAAEYHIDLQPI